MKRRRWSPTMKSVVGNGSKNIASDYLVAQALGFIANGLRRRLAESGEFVHLSCLEGRFYANGHQNGPTTPCVCCRQPVAVPCVICANAWKRGLASLVQISAIAGHGDELRPGDLDALLAVSEPQWRSA
jgi:hypothetical protein